MRSPLHLSVDRTTQIWTNILVEVLSPCVSERGHHRIRNIERTIGLGPMRLEWFGPDPNTDLVSGLITDDSAGTKLSSESNCKQQLC